MSILVVFLGIMMVLGGIYCIIFPLGAFLAIGHVLGFCMVIDGIGMIATYIFLRKYFLDKPNGDGILALIGGILSIIIGALVMGKLQFQFALDMIVLYFIIFWMIAFGIICVVNAVRVKKWSKLANAAGDDFSIGKNWWIALIFGILMIICGIVGISFPSAIANTIGVYIGVSILISGINLIYFGANMWMI